MTNLGRYFWHHSQDGTSYSLPSQKNKQFFNMSTTMTSKGPTAPKNLHYIACTDHGIVFPTSFDGRNSKFWKTHAGNGPSLPHFYIRRKLSLKLSLPNIYGKWMENGNVLIISLHKFNHKLLNITSIWFTPPTLMGTANMSYSYPWHLLHLWPVYNAQSISAKWWKDERLRRWRLPTFWEIHTVALACMFLFEPIDIWQSIYVT